MKAVLESRRMLRVRSADRRTEGVRFIPIAAGLWNSRFTVVEITDKVVRLTDDFQPKVSITVARKPISVP